MRIILLIVCFFFVFESKAEIFRGQIIKRNDTLEVVFKIPLYSVTREVKIANLHDKVIYYDSLGKKRKLFPNQALEFRFIIDGKEIRMLSRKTPYSKYYVFLKLESDGKLKSFGYYGGDPSMEFYQSDIPLMNDLPFNVLFYQKNDEELYKPKLNRKLLLEYFADCPNLCAIIRNNDLSNYDLFSIAKYYNSNCGK
jgi:hypothetical protein